VAGEVWYAPPEQMGRLPGVQPGLHSDVYAFGKTCCYARFQTTGPRRRQRAPLPEGLAEVRERCTEQELEHRQPDSGPVLAVLAALDPAAEAAGRRREEERRRPGEEPRRWEQEQPRQREGEERLRRDAEACDRLHGSGNVSVAFLDRVAPGRVGAWPEAAPRGLPAAPWLLGLA
jgi:hypothetical protein